MSTADDARARTERMNRPSLPPPYEPQETPQLLRAFPATVAWLMPAWNDIPQEFRENSNNPWRKFQNRWFTKGLTTTTRFHPKPGIEPGVGFYHLACIQGSYEPKHEHKMAAVAYLASLWYAKIIIDDDEVYP